MRFTKIAIYLLIFMLSFLYGTISAVDNYDFLKRKAPLPKNSSNLSIKNHWKYIGYYLYKLLYKNDSFTEAQKKKIDRIFSVNQKIIDQLNLDFVKDDREDDHTQFSKPTLNLGGIFFDNEDENEDGSVGKMTSDKNQEEDIQTEENEETEEENNNISSPQETNQGNMHEVEISATTADASQSEGNVNGAQTVEITSPTTEGVFHDATIPPSNTTELPSANEQFPTPEFDASSTMQQYNQEDPRDAVLPSGYNSMSDPNTMQQNGIMNGNNNMGYGTFSDESMYNNMGNQNYNGSYSSVGGQAMYGNQMYNNNSVVGSENFNGMNNSYNNMSDFQEAGQNMNMYQQQQQGIYQQQDGMQNPYDQTGGISDNQYNQQYGMAQGNEGMPQYEQQQMQQSYNGDGQQQIGYPPDYQNQENAMPISMEKQQMQPNQMQEYNSVYDGMEEQQMQPQQQSMQSEGQFADEEQLDNNNGENVDTESTSEIRSFNENSETTNQRDTPEQQQFETENSVRDIEQSQMVNQGPVQEFSESNNNSNSEMAMFDRQEHSEAMARSSSTPQESVEQEVNTSSVPMQLQNTQQESIRNSVQTSQQRQTLPYSTNPESVEPMALGMGMPSSSTVEEMNTTHSSISDGAEWNPQRGSSTWEISENKDPPEFDPNAPLTSKEF